MFEPWMCIHLLILFFFLPRFPELRCATLKTPGICLQNIPPPPTRHAFFTSRLVRSVIGKKKPFLPGTTHLVLVINCSPSGCSVGGRSRRCSLAFLLSSYLARTFPTPLFHSYGRRWRMTVPIIAPARACAKHLPVLPHRPRDQESRTSISYFRVDDPIVDVPLRGLTGAGARSGTKTAQSSGVGYAHVAHARSKKADSCRGLLRAPPGTPSCPRSTVALHRLVAPPGIYHWEVFGAIRGHPMRRLRLQRRSGVAICSGVTWPVFGGVTMLLFFFTVFCFFLLLVFQLTQPIV